MKEKKKHGRPGIIPLVKRNDRVREIRISYSGEVIYGNWRSDRTLLSERTLDKSFMENMAEEYPYLFMMGPARIIMTPIELTFLRGKSLASVVRLFKGTIESYPPETTFTPFEFADAVLAHMFLIDEYGVTKITVTRNDGITSDTKKQREKYGDKRWYKKEIKEVKKRINGRK